MPKYAAALTVLLVTLDVRTDAFAPSIPRSPFGSTAPAHLYSPINTNSIRSSSYKGLRRNNNFRLQQEVSKPTVDDSWVSKGYQNGTHTGDLKELISKIEDHGKLDAAWDEALSKEPTAVVDKEDKTGEEGPVSSDLQALDTKLDELVKDMDKLEEHQKEARAFGDLGEKLEEPSLEKLDEKEVHALEDLSEEPEEPPLEKPGQELDEPRAEIDILEEHQEEIHALENLAEQLAALSGDAMKTSLGTGPAARRLKRLAQEAKQCSTMFKAEILHEVRSNTKGTKLSEPLYEPTKALLALAVATTAMGAMSVAQDASSLSLLVEQLQNLELPQDLLNSLGDASALLEQIKFHLPPAILNPDSFHLNLGDLPQLQLPSLHIQELQESIAGSVAHMQGQVSGVQQDILHNLEGIKEAVMGQLQGAHQSVQGMVSGLGAGVEGMKESALGGMHEMKQAVPAAPSVDLEGIKGSVLGQLEGAQQSVQGKVSSINVPDVKIELPNVDVEGMKASVVSKVGGVKSGMHIPGLQGMKDAMAGMQQGMADKVSSFSAPDLNVGGIKESVLGQVNEVQQTVTAKTSSSNLHSSPVNVDVGAMKESFFSKFSSVKLPEMQPKNIDLEGVKDGVVAKTSSIKLPDMPTNINVGPVVDSPAAVVESMKASGQAAITKPPPDGLLGMMPDYKWF